MNIVRIHGARGAGKTTVLNYAARVLALQDGRAVRELTGLRHAAVAKLLQENHNANTCFVIDEPDRVVWELLERSTNHPAHLIVAFAAESSEGGRA